ncbi:MAG: division/cell wall cluster transcriptional repressor MraZ [bacterium]
MNGENSGSLEHGPNARPGNPPVIDRLIGTYERTIDSKSRIGLPHQFRDKLGNSPLILIRWMDKSLVLFPECNWLPLAENVSRLAYYTKEGQAIRRQMYANAREVSLDKEGRIIIPQDMVEYARLDGKVIVSGDWDKIMIWNHAIFLEQIAKDDVTLNEKMPSVLAVTQGRKSWEVFEKEMAQNPSGKNGSNGSA